MYIICTILSISEGDKTIRKRVSGNIEILYINSGTVAIKVISIEYVFLIVELQGMPLASDRQAHTSIVYPSV